MSKRFELCDRAGLKVKFVWRDGALDSEPMLAAADVEAYLANESRTFWAPKPTNQLPTATRVSSWEFTAEDFQANAAWIDSRSVSVVCAEIANARLAEWWASAPVVYGYDVDGQSRWDATNHPAFDTHSARLICIEPIVKDTAEGLLRELLAERKEYGTLDSTWERARKLLDQVPSTGRNPSDSECAGPRDGA